MTKPVHLYGIRNCDTMKKARAWLDAHNIVYDFHDYKVEGVGQAVHGGGVQAGVAEHDLVEVLGSRVAAVRGTHVAGHQGTNRRHLGQKIHGVALAGIDAVGAQAVGAAALVTDGARDLQGQPVEHLGDFLPHLVWQAGPVHFLTAEESRVDDIEQASDQLGDFIPGRD